jgi:hypothetical protein
VSLYPTFANPKVICRDEVELANGTILDRYTAPVQSEKGQLYGRIWTFRDVTEQKLAHIAEERHTLSLKTITTIKVTGIVISA